MMENLILSQQKKLSNPYKVTSLSKAVKDVDESKRMVTGIFNSYFYIDSDLDMLLPGAASKSIAERGVESTKGNKIKHLKDHDWGKNIAEIKVLDERTVDFDGKQITGIYHESFYPESTDSNDQLIKIQSGMYDARSIGFKYINLILAERDSVNEANRKAYEEYLPMAINPEIGEEAGFFWVVKEIKMFEGSDVAFGANELTPLLGIKTGDKPSMVKCLNDKIDKITSLMNTGKGISDEGFHQIKMEQQQIKAYIEQIIDQEPSEKDTLISRSRKDTQSKQSVKLIL